MQRTITIVNIIKNYIARTLRKLFNIATAYRYNALDGSVLEPPQDDWEKREQNYNILFFTTLFICLGAEWGW